MPRQHHLFDRLAAAKVNIKAPNLVALAEDDTLSVETLHDICYDRKHGTIAFRAAWVLEYIATYHPKRFMPVLDTFMSRLPEQQNHSCQRHFTKIVMHITHPNAPTLYQEARSTINGERLVETAFGWLIDPRTPVAVQVNCMDILFNMRNEFEWIADELVQQTTFLMKDGSAAIQSRGKKILATLRRPSKF
ncbi:hypothetical protein SAMN05660226_01442 [Parapedobacter luteus]|uniref:DNA alkylation repair enzyme n=1 Tax=Parapedobacter luteus TaxID=623280 RepID=A0A1T5BF22_9SPHI|nr:hypothetical protein [Parapedobacter luteus]SKB45894.1 hypothetical protein SAMN05660226_01442 [Parapedobacter luteus]